MPNNRLEDRQEINSNRLNKEHSTQIQLMQSLIAAIGASSDTDQIIKIYDQLLSYTGLHFLSEQLLMKQYNYNEYELHSSDHASVMEQLRTLQEKFRDQPSEVFSGEVDEIGELLSEHIGNHDNSLHRFLAKQSQI